MGLLGSARRFSDELAPQPTEKGAAGPHDLSPRRPLSPTYSADFIYLTLPLYRLFTSHIPLSMNADKKLADATATIMEALGFRRVSDVSGALGLDFRTSVPPPPT